MSYFQAAEMRIAINGLVCGMGGAATELKNTLLGLSRIDHDNQYTVFYSILSEPYVLEIKDRLSSNFRFFKVAFPRPWVLNRILWEQIVFPFVLWKQKIHVLYSPSNIITWLAPCRKVLLVWDLNLHTGFRLNVYTHTRWALRFRIRRLLSKISCWISDRIVFASNQSKEVISKDFGIPDRKGVTIHRGVSEMFLNSKHALEKTGPVATRCLSLRPYIFSSSVVYQHKNYGALVKAFGKLANSAFSRYNLVIAGSLLDEQEYWKIVAIGEEYGLTGRVHFLGEVRHNSLPALYCNASVFVFPTLLESFGFPAVEAMASGVPVLVSDIPIMREICEDGALYFDPTDTDALAFLIEKVLCDERLQHRLREAGQRQAAKFTVAAATRALLDVFSDVVPRETLFEAGQ